MTIKVENLPFDLNLLDRIVNQEKKGKSILVEMKPTVLWNLIFGRPHA